MAWRIATEMAERHARAELGNSSGGGGSSGGNNSAAHPNQADLDLRAWFESKGGAFLSNVEVAQVSD